MKKKVMVVDDSRIVHKKMAEFLEGTDFEIVCFCRSGEEALERYPEVKPDVVTVDIVMPGEGGMAAARKLRELDPDARLLMVSSLAYDALVDEGWQGQDAFAGLAFDLGRASGLLTEAQTQQLKGAVASAYGAAFAGLAGMTGDE